MVTAQGHSLIQHNNTLQIDTQTQTSEFWRHLFGVKIWHFLTKNLGIRVKGILLRLLRKLHFPENLNSLNFNLKHGKKEWHWEAFEILAIFSGSFSHYTRFTSFTCCDRGFGILQQDIWRNKIKVLLFFWEPFFWALGRLVSNWSRIEKTTGTVEELNAVSCQFLLKLNLCWPLQAAAAATFTLTNKFLDCNIECTVLNLVINSIEVKHSSLSIVSLFSPNELQSFSPRVAGEPDHNLLLSTTCCVAGLVMRRHEMTQRSKEAKNRQIVSVRICLLARWFVSSPMYFHSSWQLNQKPKRCLKNRECKILPTAGETEEEWKGERGRGRL